MTRQTLHDINGAIDALRKGASFSTDALINLLEGAMEAARSDNASSKATERAAFEFDRYIDGVLMAEGVTIERQPSLPSATREAARIASRGPAGETPVLVLRADLAAPRADAPVAVKAAVDEIVRQISEQASAMAEMALSGLPENSRNRESMEAALTQMSHIIRAAHATVTLNRMNGGGTKGEISEKVCPAARS